jgi:hypothetical protein
MFHRKWCRTTTSLVLATIFLIGSVSFLAMVDTVQAPSPYQLKWAFNYGTATHIGALSANIVPGAKGQEIILDGVSAVDQGFSNGSVVALNGTNGALLWKTDPSIVKNIQDHSPFEIYDLNNNGQLEIVVADMPSTLALYGNNGSIYWQNNAAPSFDLTPVIADVDGNGYPEVFVASGNGPYRGYDYITELSHTGSIIAQTNSSWHPCYGGVTLADPYNNGSFILLMGDRSSSYNPASDPYHGGGWGVRAMNATTLAPLWNDSTVLCSSQIPMLADVDGTGIPEVVISYQSRGLAVYNITTGQVDNTSGIYRYAKNLNLTEHSQPTIYIDQNGIPQFITNEGDYPKVWDLRDWTLTATINMTVDEPPKMGSVTADGKQDIIVVQGNVVHIFDQSFQEVGNITGLNNPNQFTLVSDVDGDGYNELVLTSRSGWVYCYSTPALAASPAPRSNVEFYSENRVGVSQYVNPPGPSTPIITALSPANGANNVSTSLPSLSFKLLDYWGNPLNYTVATTPNIGSGSGTNVFNGVYSIPINSLSPSTSYSWTVTATDGIYSNSTTFTFNTVLGTPLNIDSPSPASGSVGVPANISSLSFILTDGQSNHISYAVTTSPDIGSGGDTNKPNGTYSISVSGLANSTTYSWQINATDNIGNKATATYTFTTSSTTSWWNSSWLYRTNVTINHANVMSNLNGFPVLISLTSSNLAAHAQTNGNDIVFIDSSGHKLNHEIESYNSVLGQLTAWVMVPNLSSTKDSVLSMYYGNPSSPDQENLAGVWDSNFLMVQHLNATSTALIDSTSNNNDGTATGGVTPSASGEIAGCETFTGGSIQLPTVLSSQTQFTFSAWIYPQAGARYFISEWNNNQGAFLQVSGNSVVQMYVNGIMAQKTVSLNQWHYVVGTFNGTTASLWVDGGSPSSASALNPIWASQNMYLGNRNDGTRQFIGLLDEVRVSNIARSNAWILTEYANQKNPLTFYTIGVQEKSP